MIPYRPVQPLLNRSTWVKHNNMIEVFKTDVSDGEAAKRLLLQLHENFKTYTANFDLEDCDLILRVQCHEGLVCALSIIELLKKNGFHAEVLPDDFQPELSSDLHFSTLIRTILRE